MIYEFSTLQENVPQMVVTEAPDESENKGLRLKSPRKAAGKGPFLHVIGNTILNSVFNFSLKTLVYCTEP